MKLYVSILLIFFFLTGALLGNTGEIIKELDNLHLKSMHEKVKEQAEGALNKTANNREKAELYWRQARATCYLGDKAEEQGKEQQAILAYFEKGEALAQKAIESDSGNPNGYFWKSANIGRWGQVKGILDSLGKADPMRKLLVQAVQADPENHEAFDTLGQLYELIPGWPISFGNVEYSVSLGRKAVALQEKRQAAGQLSMFQYGFYTNLAGHLWTRNWDARKRKSFQKDIKGRYNEKRKDLVEKNFYYEAAAALTNQSDREEAAELIKMVITKLSSLPRRTKHQNAALKHAQKKRGEWGL